MPANGDELIAALGELRAKLHAALPGASAQAALVIQAAGMRKTPVKTGALRRSWHIEPFGEGTRVAPTMIYARRIELGFHGPDKLGRVYHQAGKPYVKPAFDESRIAARNVAIRTISAALIR